MKKNQSLDNNKTLSCIMLILVIGSLRLALLDEDSRTTFSDLAKVGVGGYIGLLMPRQKTK
jgi:hypothetical protein